MTTMTKTNNLQEIFLTQARRERRPVTMFLMNVVVVTSDGKQQVIYKHAISTIVPERPVPLTEESVE